MKRVCDHPDCEKEGLYRAPKTKALNSYYHFCLDHVKEYNKNWNFYEGLEGDAFDKQIEADKMGTRPSWNKTKRLTPEDLKNINDPLEWLGKVKRANPSSPFKSESEEEKALKTLGLKWPTTYDKMKSKYKEWVKKVHPDMTKGKTEEEFKIINEAFTTLHNHFKK